MPKWTDPELVPYVTRVKTVHVEELRTISEVVEDILNNHVGAGDGEHSLATREKSGFMSAQDKVSVQGYTHVQSEENSTWTINHNLNKFPSILIFDGESNEIIGDITYLDQNSLSITFSTPVSGTAYIS